MSGERECVMRHDRDTASYRIAPIQAGDFPTCARMHRAMARMSEELGEKNWCHGERYSLADIAFGCCLGWLAFRRPGEVDWHAEYQALARHYYKLMERPAFAETAPQLPPK